MLTITIIFDYTVMVNPIPCDRTRGCFSLESFTRRSYCCNGQSIYNLSSPSSFGVLPSLPHMEDADYQQQAMRAITIIPHFILDTSEATMKN